MLITREPSSCPVAHIFNCIYHNLKFADVYCVMNQVYISKYLASHNRKTSWEDISSCMPGNTCIITGSSMTITISKYSRNTDPIRNLLINTYRTLFCWDSSSLTFLPSGILFAVKSMCVSALYPCILKLGRCSHSKFHWLQMESCGSWNSIKCLSSLPKFQMFCHIKVTWRN